MPGLLFVDVELPTPDGFGSGWLATDGSRIGALGLGRPPAADAPVTRIDGRGRTLLPGFVDVHFHGAVGHEVMDGDVDGLTAMARFAAGHGVTSFLATTWTGSREQTAAALATVKAAVDAPRPAGAARTWRGRTSTRPAPARRTPRRSARRIPTRSAATSTRASCG